MNIPSVICSLAALAALASAVAMIAASVLIVRSAWTGNVTDNSITARSLMDGATSMRNAGIALLLVLFMIASDSTLIAGGSRMWACSALCRGYAGALVPALLLTLVADLICLFKKNANSTLANLRSTTRFTSFWGIAVGLVLAYVLLF